MTWQLGVYGGRSGDSQVNRWLKRQSVTRIATSAPLVLLKEIVIPSASEGSPYPITVLSKTDLQRTFIKFCTLCDLLYVVFSSRARNRVTCQMDKLTDFVPLFGTMSVEGRRQSPIFVIIFKIKLFLYHINKKMCIKITFKRRGNVSGLNQ